MYRQTSITFIVVSTVWKWKCYLINIDWFCCKLNILLTLFHSDILSLLFHNFVISEILLFYNENEDIFQIVLTLNLLRPFRTYLFFMLKYSGKTTVCYSSEKQRVRSTHTQRSTGCLSQKSPQLEDKPQNTWFIFSKKP